MKLSHNSKASFASLTSLTVLLMGPFQCFLVIGWGYFQAINDPVQQPVSKKNIFWGWAYIWGWVYYREITAISIAGEHNWIILVVVYSL